MDLLSPATLRRWAVANLVANMAIVWTGALVRLTGSGLGCSTWPQCEAGSYTPHPEAPWHAFVEFGNRLLTFVLIGISLATFLAARRALRAEAVRPLVPRLAFAVGLGIIAQAVIGGLSVLAQLNPWVVGLHMVVSVGLIVLCTKIVHEVFGLPARGLGRTPWLLTQGVFWGSMLMMYLGTITSGAGPHSGDGAATRNGLAVTDVARLHSLTMWVTLGLAGLLLIVGRSDRRLRGAVLGVLGAAALQAVIGYAQYLNGLPLGLVLAHMVGTTLYTVAVAHLWFGVGRSAQNSSGSIAAAMNTTAR